MTFTLESQNRLNRNKINYKMKTLLVILVELMLVLISILMAIHASRAGVTMGSSLCKHSEVEHMPAISVGLVLLLASDLNIFYFISHEKGLGRAKMLCRSPLLHNAYTCIEIIIYIYWHLYTCIQYS